MAAQAGSQGYDMLTALRKRLLAPPSAANAITNTAANVQVPRSAHMSGAPSQTGSTFQMPPPAPTPNAMRDSRVNENMAPASNPSTNAANFSSSPSSQSPSMAPTTSGLAARDPNAEPSLRGDPEALMEALAFSKEVKSGGKSGSHSRGRRLAATGSTSGGDSPRFAKVAPAVPAFGSVPTPASSPRPTATPLPASSTSFGSTSNPAASQWNAFATKPQPQAPVTTFIDQTKSIKPTVKEATEDAIEQLTSKMEKVGMGSEEHVANSPSKPSDSGSRAFAGHANTIKNILNDLAADNKSSPPHLRAKASGAPKTTPAEASSDNTVKRVTSPPKPTVEPKESPLKVEPTNAAGTTAERSTTPVAPVATQPATTKEVKPATAFTTINGTFGDKPTTAHSTPNGVSKVPVQAEETNISLNDLIGMVAALKKRVDYLEKDNAELSTLVTKMREMEERRKFLGTDSAKAPFPIKVRTPDGIVANVQASANTKVSELIRRLHTATGIFVTPEPRILIGGKQYGHGQLLDDAGMRKGDGEDLEVVFTYKTD